MLFILQNAVIMAVFTLLSAILRFYSKIITIMAILLINRVILVESSAIC